MASQTPCIQTSNLLIHRSIRYLRPTQRYTSLTALHSVSVGGHFLAASTLRRSILGAIHQFFKGGVASSDDTIFQERIDSLVCFYHKALTASNLTPEGK
jgi:hypothetical protein